jgi:hypothetical protein
MGADEFDFNHHKHPKIDQKCLGDYPKQLFIVL